MERLRPAFTLLSQAKLLPMILEHFLGEPFGSLTRDAIS